MSYDLNRQVRDCKTAYHREQDKPDRDQIAKLIAQQKSINSRINYLITSKGNEVVVEELDRFKIILSECLDFSIAPDGIITFIFLKHAIVTNPFNYIAKISHND